jgi:hypothetical protein
MVTTIIINTANEAPYDVICDVHVGFEVPFHLLA